MYPSNKADEERPPNSALTEESCCNAEDDESTPQHEDVLAPKGCCSPARIGIGVFLVAVISFVVVDSLTEGYMREGIASFLAWVEKHPREGVVLFMFGTLFKFMEAILSNHAATPQCIV